MKDKWHASARSVIAALAHCLIASLLVSWHVQAQRSGTSSLSGGVVTDEAVPQPLRRALVSLRPADGAREVAASTVATDDEGRFALTGVRPGRYSLSASKPGYVTGAYGAARPGRAGTPMQIGVGQRVTNLVLRLARGAVVTGAVLDQHGDLMPSMRVSLFRYVFQASNGERTLQPTDVPGTSDDRGQYRIYGITPGEYLVQLHAPLALPGDVRAMDGHTVAFAPVFYPGATTPDGATLLKLSAGEERAGVDLQFQMVRTATIEGVVVGSDGAPRPDAQVSLLGAGPPGLSVPNMLSAMFGRGRADAGGRFTLSGIAPGRYTLAARAARLADGAPDLQVRGLWATAEIDVSGQDVSGLRLTLEPGLRVSGRVVVQGAAPPPDLTKARVTLAPLLTGTSVAMVTPPAAVRADGSFVFNDMTPGRYRWAIPSLAAAAREGRGEGEGRAAGTEWRLASAVVQGGDTLDTGLEIRAGESPSATLTLTDRVTTLDGTLQDANGRPAPDYFVIVFASDRAWWTPPSRRVAMTRPGSDGTFSVRGLPAGDYLIAAVTDVEPGEWMDPAFLAQIVSASIRITLAEGEWRRQEIRIARQ